jgi:DNA-binding NarL/FixJ family response regulator
MSTRAAGFANRSASIDPKRDTLSAICLSGAFIKHGRAATLASLGSCACDRHGAVGINYLGQAVAQTLAMINVTPFNDPLRYLSDREQQIVKLLGDGKSLTEISALLPLGLDLRRRYK